MLGIRDVTAEILKLNGGNANLAETPNELLQATLNKIDQAQEESELDILEQAIPNCLSRYR